MFWNLRWFRDGVGLLCEYLQTATKRCTMRLDGPQPLIIAHRGGHYPGLRGEQTVDHFERATALGVDLIEVDLHETADRQIVCVHDPVYAGVVVSRVTYSELKDASARLNVPRPALLAELVELTRGKVGLDLELKAPGFEERLVAQIRRSLDMEGTIFKSFHDQIVQKIKILEPDCTAGLLLGVEHPTHRMLTRLSELFPERRLKRCMADFVSPHYHLVRLGFAKRMKQLQKPLLIWTVNHPQECAAVLTAAHGIITDQPAMFMEWRRQVFEKIDKKTNDFGI